jgi:hydroxylamine oxidation protein HaoB
MDLVRHGTRPGSPALWTGLALLVAGSLILLFGWPDFSADSFRHAKAEILRPGDPKLPDLGGRFPPDELVRYAIGRGEASVSLHVAGYRDAAGAPRRAIIYPPSAAPALLDGDRMRSDLWKKAAEAILKYTDEKALFLSWWDDAERVHFLTGRSSWASLPAAGAFPDADERRFWKEAAGGFAEDGEPLRQLARWLTLDADQSLAEMAERWPRDQPVFLMVCLDDLARLSEMEALSGASLPLEAKFFPNESNLHGQIAAVKRWAGEPGGSGNYLLQPVPGAGIRAWRTTSAETDKTLLVRLLPFVRSVAELPTGVKLVYQSGQGGYLSIFQLQTR